MDIWMPRAATFSIVFRGDFVAELDSAAAVKAGVRLGEVEGWAIGVGWHAVAVELSGGFGGERVGGEGAKDG